MSNRNRSAPSGPLIGEKISDVDVTGAITGATTVDLTATVAGLDTTDLITVVPQAALPEGVVLGGARVTAADTIAIRVGKITVGDVASATYAFDIHVNHYSS